MNKKVRTRFAPSPTGKQHIGGFRTAIYPWLFAKKHNGDFLLRVEDTDQDRSQEGAIDYLISSFEWLGIDIDEGPSNEEFKKLKCSLEPDYNSPKGPYIQSLRKEIYSEYAEKLIEKGHAYRCDCTTQMLDMERKRQMARKEAPGYSGYCRTRKVSKDTEHVVRLRLPDDFKISFEDGVRGLISWDNPPLRDPVILKSDKMPTYHLASVVDDTLMEITHVFRGEEWVPTTPIHLLLYKLLELEPPVFCHLPTILGGDGKKLSKRTGAESLDYYKDMGFLPEALINYITLIGWSPGKGSEQEVFTIKELINSFSIEHINNSNGVFDQQKLIWMNSVYLKKLDHQDFEKIAVKEIAKKSLNFDKNAWDKISCAVQDRVKLTSEIADEVEFLFSDLKSRELESILKKIDAQTAITVLEAAKLKLENLSSFELDDIEKSLKLIPKELDLKMGQVLIPIRIATTGKMATPPLFSCIYALGKEKSVNRINECILELEN